MGIITLSCLLTMEILSQFCAFSCVFLWQNLNFANYLRKLLTLYRKLIYRQIVDSDTSENYRWFEGIDVVVIKSTREIISKKIAISKQILIVDPFPRLTPWPAQGPIPNLASTASSSCLHSAPEPTQNSFIMLLKNSTHLCDLWREGAGSNIDYMQFVSSDDDDIMVECLSVCGSQKSLFLYSKDFVVSPVSRHFPYSVTSHCCIQGILPFLLFIDTLGNSF